MIAEQARHDVHPTDADTKGRGLPRRGGSRPPGVSCAAHPVSVL